MEKIQEAYSPSLERISQLRQLKVDKDNGIYSGIPLWESFPGLSEVIPTIDKGQVILNFASSGVGKSMITRYKDILVPWLFVSSHPELNIDLRFVIFLLEDDITRFKDYMISAMLYYKHGISKSPKELQSKFKKSLDLNILDKLDDISIEVDSLLSICTIEDSIANSYGIYKTCRLKSEEWGVHYYTPLLSPGSKKITRSEYNELPKLQESLKELSVDELQKKHGLDPLNYKDYWKYSNYVTNNPNTHVIGVIDNVNCLEPDKNEGILMTAIENLAYNYIRKNICKHWQWTFSIVQQSMGSAEETQYDYRGGNIISKLVPNLSHLGDSKKSQRAMHTIYALFDPFRYEIQEFMGYNISILKDKCRFMFLLKNNDGFSYKVVPLLFIGASGWFKELPSPDKMQPIYDKIKKGEIL